MIPPALETAYIQNHDQPVAYIDESYNANYSNGYYILTAAIVEESERDRLRRDLINIAGGPKWHTTDEMQTATGKIKTKKLLEYMGEGPEEYIISFTSKILPGDRTGEKTREQVFNKLYSKLASKIELFVLDRRIPNERANADADIKKRAIQNGICPPQTRLLQVKPFEEQLLWLPDIACSAYRRKVGYSEPEYFDYIQSVSTII